MSNRAPAKNLPSDVVLRIAAVKNRKPPEPSPFGFAFDPDQPLRLIDPAKQKPVSKSAGMRVPRQLPSFQIWINGIPDSGSSFF
jgi:hypothetical protein